MDYENCNCGPGYRGRRYLSREEKTAMLNDYAKELEREIKAVRERIEELEKS